MPFFIHYNDRDEPQEVSEGEAKHILDVDFHDTTMRAEMWKRLMKGQKVHVRLGYVIWERLTGY